MLWTGLITKWRSTKDWKVTEKYSHHNSKAINNMVFRKTTDNSILEFSQLSIVESIFNKKCVLVAGIFGWWYDFSDIEKAAVIGGPLLFIIILITACCCCCGCCRSRPTNQGAVIVTPAAVPTAVMATNTRRTVPMKPLVNEAWVSLQSRRTQSLPSFYSASNALPADQKRQKTLGTRLVSLWIDTVEQCAKNA